MATASRVLTFLLLLSFSAISLALEAQRFIILKNGAQPINIAADHITVGLVSGWAYSKSGVIEKILSKNSKFIVSLDSKCKFFDGAELSVSTVHENTDIKRNVSRPWGVNYNVISNMPADTECEVTAKILINKDDVFTSVFDALKAAEPGLGDSFDPAWSGYSSALSQLSNYFFGTNTDKVPFVWGGNIKLGAVATEKELLPHYLVLVSPHEKGDSLSLDGGKLAYDAVGNRLTYDGKLLDTYSYAVFDVSAGSGYDVGQMIFQSSAPWAVLAQSFLSLPISSAADKKSLETLANSLLDNYSKEIVLLNKEMRFSRFDRASAMLFFAKRAQKQVDDHCAILRLNTEECPSKVIANFVETIEKLFGIPSGMSDQLDSAVDRLFISTAKHLE